MARKSFIFDRFYKVFCIRFSARSKPCFTNAFWCFWHSMETKSPPGGTFMMKVSLMKVSSMKVSSMKVSSDLMKPSSMKASSMKVSSMKVSSG